MTNKDQDIKKEREQQPYHTNQENQQENQQEDQSNQPDAEEEKQEAPEDLSNEEQPEEENNPENAADANEKKDKKADKKSDKKSGKKSGKKDKKDDKDNKDKRIEELQHQLKEMQDKYLRLSAEFDNYRKRTLKEKMELTKSAGENILQEILPVMDNFERAQQSVKEAKDVDAVTEGIDLIYNRFKAFLEQNGIKEIEAQDKDFNTDEHEAVTKIPAPSEEQKGKVVDVIQKGYYLNDKVLRYAKVVVGE